MLYWCGFEIIWKLYVAIMIGLVMTLIHQRKNILACSMNLYGFLFYMTVLLLLAYVGSFGGIGLLAFPHDVLVILPFSICMLYGSQRYLLLSVNIDILERAELETA